MTETLQAPVGSDLDQVVRVLRQIRREYPSTQAMAEAAGVDYTSLWRLLDGQRRGAIKIELLTALMARWVAVAAVMGDLVAQKEEAHV